MNKLTLTSGMTLACALSIIANADPTLAKWEAHQVEFTYSSFTSYYTCRGIESKLKTIMKGIGANEDIRVHASCSRGFNEPSEIIKVKMALSMPVPVEEAEITAETFMAEWQAFRLRNRHPRRLEPGDCELIEELNRKVFPQIGIDVTEDRTRCVPRSANRHGINTRMNLLIAVEEPEQEIIKD